VKFLKDISSLLATVIEKRIPEHQRKGFAGLLVRIQEDIDRAIEDLRHVRSPEDKVFDGLRKAGLLGEALIVKLDEFRDRITHGPLLAVLKMGDTILGSLCSVLHLEPLKEFKETLENKVEFGADDEIIKLNLYS
jgi:hypothetical protein